MSDTWTFYAVEFRTGEVLVDLPLVDFSGAVSLVGGPMSARLPLGHLGAAQAQALLDFTIPGRHSIVGLRNGVVRGEWIIWQRTRTNTLDPVQLAGTEVMSFLERRVMPQRNYSQIEQLDIARDMISAGFGPSPQGNGGVGIQFATYSASGQKRDRAYKLVDGTIGQRLKELGAVINGFDYWITPEWTGGSGQIARIARTVRFGYPRAGSDQDLVFETASRGFGLGGGNVLGFQLAEDAQDLASRTFTIGADVLIGQYEDDALITRDLYPFMEKSASYTTVTEQATLDSYARALWDDAQLGTLPGGLVVLADGSPGIGDWSLGDVVTVVVEESVNFPQGARVDVRILGWTFRPPAAGPETITLEVSQEGPVGDHP